MKITKSLL